LRYSPIWALYTILLLLILFGEAEYDRANIAKDMVYFMRDMTWINLFYGGICGVFLFMDLFNGRLCNALHAFPMRRESWLATHLLSGFLFSFVPNLLVAGIGALLLWEYAYMAFIWLAISTLQFLFFFGTAALAATCAGNLLGSAALFGITHFVTVFVYAVTELFYQPLLYGLQMNSKAFYRFFPIYQMVNFDYADLEVYYDSVEPRANFYGLEGAAWRYVGICAAVGVLCMFLACLVYCRRNLESAGDFISLRPLAPVFIFICTIGAGAFLYMFSELVSGNKSYLFLILGIVIGYFAGKMLLNRTLKVFGKKSILALLVLAAVFGSSLYITWLDPLGVVRYVPKAENVEAAYLWGADKSGYYMPEYSFLGSIDVEKNGYKITGEEKLTDLQDFHRQLTQYRPSEDDGTLCDVQICYVLRSGRTVNRYYEVGRDTALGQKAGEYFSDMRYIFEVNDTAVLYDAFESVSVDIYEDENSTSYKLIQQQDITDLLDAIAKDCEAGTMAQNWAYHKETGKARDCYVEFSVKDEVFAQGGWDVSRFYLHIYEDGVNTISYLKDKATAYSNTTE